MLSVSESVSEFVSDYVSDYVNFQFIDLLKQLKIVKPSIAMIIRNG